MEQNPAKQSSVRVASAPPHSITSAWFNRMALNASPMACAPEAQAETVV